MVNVKGIYKHSKLHENFTNSGFFHPKLTMILKFNISNVDKYILFGNKCTVNINLKTEKNFPKKVNFQTGVSL